MAKRGSKKPAAAKAKKALEVEKPKRMRISPTTVARSRQKPTRDLPTEARAVFRPAVPPPGVFPTAAKQKMAMDEASNMPGLDWAASQLAMVAFSQGYSFMGYTLLSELAQVPEFRLISEVISTEMTRKWIDIKSAADQKDKESGGEGNSQAQRINDLMEEMKRLNVRECFEKIALYDGLMGRAHLYIDTGDTDNPNELKKPLGSGEDKMTLLKIEKGTIKAFRPVEAVWCYPSLYNSNNPLRPDWYKPQIWFCMGIELHVTRLLPFIGREVPDLLKPSFSFGGLSRTQMSKPYVDNWLETRQSVNRMIHSFSVMVLKTNMGASLSEDSQEMFDRADLFTNMANNRNLMMLDKESEEFGNVSASLASLDKLQAQAQEHMASVSRIPLVKLLGITPTGLNASTDGEVRSFYDTINAYQQQFFTPHLTTVFKMCQLNLWGKIDPDLSFDYAKLHELTEKEQAEVDEIMGRTDNEAIDRGVLAPIESRRRIANNPDSGHASLDVSDVPEPDGPFPKNIKETERDDPENDDNNGEKNGGSPSADD